LCPCFSQEGDAKVGEIFNSANNLQKKSQKKSQKIRALKLGN
jgi:hypothetical protein